MGSWGYVPFLYTRGFCGCGLKQGIAADSWDGRFPQGWCLSTAGLTQLLALQLLLCGAECMAWLGNQTAGSVHLEQQFPPGEEKVHVHTAISHLGDLLTLLPQSGEWDTQTLGRLRESNFDVFSCCQRDVWRSKRWLWQGGE